MRFQKHQMNYYSIITLGMNIVSIIMGIFYFVIGPDLIFGVLFGIILVISWFLDIGLVLLDDFNLIKSTPTGKKLNRLGFGYIGFQMIALFCIVAGIFLVNADWMTPLIQYLLVCIGFFGFFLFGSILAYMNIKILNNREVWKFE